MKKIAFIGPESTGKSDTSIAVASLIDGVYVPEVAREYLKDIKTDYSVEDIYNIAKLQKKTETELISIYQDNTYLIDTESICIYIWLDFYDFPIPDWLIDTIRNDDYDLYLLCDIDLPWISDDLRENPNDRKQIFDNFVKALDQFQKPYKVLKGVEEERIHNALGIIERL